MSTFVPPTIDFFGGQLADLTRCDDNRMPDALRKLTDAAGNQGLGAYLNSLATQANAASSAVAATVTATVAGTPVAGDTLSMTMTPPGSQQSPSSPLPAVTVIHSLTSGDAASVTAAAAAMVTAWNANAAAAALAHATNTAGAVLLTAILKGTAANSYKFSVLKTGAGTTTFTASAATVTGGSGVNDTPLIV